MPQPLALQEVEDGVLIPVRAKPRGRANRIEGVRDGALLISVCASPEDGKANSAIVAVLSKSLNCAKTTVSLHQGAKSRDKLFLARNLSIAEVDQKFETIG